MTRPRHTELAAHRAHELRSNLTISEASLWIGLKGKKAGARFRRQVPIGIYIVDFASFRPRLVIEVDDLSHDLRDERQRTAYIRDQGFWMLRFWNHEIRDDVNAALDAITSWVEHLNLHGRPPD